MQQHLEQVVDYVADPKKEGISFLIEEEGIRNVIIESQSPKFSDAILTLGYADDTQLIEIELADSHDGAETDQDYAFTLTSAKDELFVVAIDTYDTDVAYILLPDSQEVLVVDIEEVASTVWRHMK